MGGPEPDEERTDVPGGTESEAEVMGGPEPEEQRTDVLGGTESEADVMGGRNPTKSAPTCWAGPSPADPSRPRADPALNLNVAGVSLGMPSGGVGVPMISMLTVGGSHLFAEHVRLAGCRVKPRRSVVLGPRPGGGPPQPCARLGFVPALSRFC